MKSREQVQIVQVFVTYETPATCTRLWSALSSRRGAVLTIAGSAAKNDHADRAARKRAGMDASIVP